MHNCFFKNIAQVFNKFRHSFEVHSNESACRKNLHLGQEQVKYDLTSDLLSFRLVTRVNYINNCKAVFDFNLMVLFLICLGLWFFGGLSGMIL